MSTVISAKNITKQFSYWSDRPSSLKTILVDALKGKFHFGKKIKFTALNDVSFDIQQGEFVGIMGRNGAGKSTLMKIIAGIYKPSEGKITINGQIAPLIELGAGFHPDLSGYENIFLNASILGFGKSATLKALPEILEFAELDEKIYMPIKNYSSGMLVRLGFSVATHLTAPIILIDEVLAVGDAGFQEKCLKKIRNLYESGRTIILVTHSPESVRLHCTRCIVIVDQKKAFDGGVEEGIQKYIQAVHTPSH